MLYILLNCTIIKLHKAPASCCVVFRLVSYRYLVYISTIITSLVLVQAVPANARLSMRPQQRSTSCTLPVSGNSIRNRNHAAVVYS